MGILDADGYLSIVDRTKDMLLYKGYNVFPRELEELLFGLPGVAGAAVVGRPDEEAGELPVAYVVRKAGDAGAALTVESVMTAVNGRWCRTSGCATSSSSTRSRSRPPARCSSASSPPASGPQQALTGVDSCA